jgi:hypothetical protein
MTIHRLREMLKTAAGGLARRTSPTTNRLLQTRHRWKEEVKANKTSHGTLEMDKYAPICC